MDVEAARDVDIACAYCLRGVDRDVAGGCGGGWRREGASDLPL